METIEQPKSLAERTHDILLDAICSGEFEPGERLNQYEIAARLNVSRQPVNSAISVLKVNGFVEETGRRGVVVKQITADEFLSIYEFHTALEPFAVRLACARKPDTAAQEAREILDRGRQAIETNDATAKVLTDAAFHEMIYRWTANPTIVGSVRMHWRHIRRAIGLVVRQGVPTQTSWDEHTRIIEAMMRDDVETAVSEMENHIAHAQSKTIARLSDADSEA